MDENDTQTAAENATPATLVAQRVRTVPRLQYLHSYSYVFEGERGFSNLMLLSVCLMIPIIGPIIAAGYQYEVISCLHRFPKTTYPAFDFGKFGDYLSRGIWKFLADMVSQVILVPVFFVLYFVTIFALGATAITVSESSANNTGLAVGIAAMIVVPLDILVILAVTIGIRLILNPLILKASLSGEAGDMFDIAFMTDFVRKTWRETIWEVLWVYVTWPIVAILGLMFCIIGILPAFAWSLMADAHTNWQLYEVYLARGGKPVQLKIEKPGPVVYADVLES